MVKVALLVGVSEYQPGLSSLPSAVEDAKAMAEVLRNPDMGGFDDVKVLPNPDTQKLREAMYDLFAERSKDDLVLFYFSGHGVKDQDRSLYLATPQTRKNTKGLVVPPTAVAASDLQQQLSSRCDRQVIILDCCYSGAIAKGLTAKDEGEIDIQAVLGGKGRAILTSSTSVQSSFEQEGGLSVYTQYLVEGIKTGAADIDSDGRISADELHQYASDKVISTYPAMTPQFYPVQEGYRIFLARSPQDDPELKYRKEVTKRVNKQGKISGVGRKILDKFRADLNLTLEQAEKIEADVLLPYQKYQDNLQEYAEVFREECENKYPLTDDLLSELEYFQRILGLRDEDVSTIQQEIKSHFSVQEEVESVESSFPELEQLMFPRTYQLKQLKQELVKRDEQINILQIQIKQLEQKAKHSEKLQQSLVREQQQSNSNYSERLNQHWQSFFPKTPQVETNIELKSAKNIDYTTLEKLLQAQEWRKADEETTKIMLKVSNRESENRLEVEDIENFPCEDVRTIDKLWLKYSNGKFGLSMQKRIYCELGGTSEYDSAVWDAFGDKVGWRRSGKWIGVDEVRWDLQAPDGHLPPLAGIKVVKSSLFSRTDL